MNSDFEEGKSYFWNLNKNSRYKKNLYDCIVQVQIRESGFANFHFLSIGQEILFAEFYKVKVTNEFIEACLKKKTRKSNTRKPIVFIPTRYFEKEPLINFLLSAKGGDTLVNDAFDKFVCLWL